MADGAQNAVLVVGGTGVFGSRLAEGLIRDGVAGVTVAGRDGARLTRVAERLGCRSVRLDVRDPALYARLAEIAPRIVIDAAGPFQTYPERDPYRLARAALASGAHYFDLSDDAGFTAGIGALDADARAAGRRSIGGRRHAGRCSRTFWTTGSPRCRRKCGNCTRWLGRVSGAVRPPRRVAQAGWRGWWRGCSDFRPRARRPGFGCRWAS